MAGSLSATATLSVTASFGTPRRLVFITQPQTTPAGAVITPAVQVAAEDSAGNIVASFDGLVRLLIAGGFNFFADLTGTTVVAAVNGIATFSDLSISRPGGLNMQLEAFPVSAPLGGTNSDRFDVPGGTPAKLAFLFEPSYALGALCPNVTPVEVQVQDSAGNPVVTYTGTITLSIGANPGGRVLTGRLSGTPFNNATPLADIGSVWLGAPDGNLKISQPGNGYTLVASGPGLPSTTSTPFDMPAPSACPAS